MIPSWFRTVACLFCACVVAVSIGSFLPELGEVGAYLLGLTIVCFLCLVTNNFPLLLALAICYPFAAPLPFVRMLPTIALVVVWFCLLAFFRCCMQQSIKMSPSCNLFIVLTFLWVPIRFILSPVHKFGGTVVGGAGVSGMNAYFMYIFAALLVIIIGTIIDTRKKLISTMRWQIVFSLIIGIGLSICAFIPSTEYFLVANGMFHAGELVPGVLRIVNLGGYGLFLVGAALCPTLFRLNKFASLLLLTIGCGMIVLGGDRGAALEFVMLVPIILFLRRKFLSLFVLSSLSVAGIIAMVIYFHSMPPNEVPGYARLLGLVDTKIEKATGGDASAEWRYAVWAKGIERIKEAPLIGKGFGNLPHSIDPTDMKEGNWGTDFDVVLAVGLAHNGWIDAAYGFGIPFTFALTAIIVQRLLSHVFSAIRTYRVDTELSEFHANLAGFFFSLFAGLYTAFDLSIYIIWFYVGIGLVLDHVTRKFPLPTLSIARLPKQINEPVFH